MSPSLLSYLLLSSLFLVTSTHWSSPTRFRVLDYDGDVIMSPHFSRDGHWLFFSTENKGDNISLHYAQILNSTAAKYMGHIGGQANGPVPHLDAVPSIDENNTLYWTSTRDFPGTIENLMHGTFINGSVPEAKHLLGDIYYHPGPTYIWIVMDSEINADGTILFYVNAAFSIPPGPIPVFSNISMAIKQPDGSFKRHPNAEEIMKSVNNVRGKEMLRFAPSSSGYDGLELYFTVQLPNATENTALYVATRKTREEVFGEPEQIVFSSDELWVNPDSAAVSKDGERLVFSRNVNCTGSTDVDCDKIGVYVMMRRNESGVENVSKRLGMEVMMGVLVGVLLFW